MPSIQAKLLAIPIKMMSVWLESMPLGILRAGMRAGVDRKLAPARVNIVDDSINNIPVEWIKPRGVTDDRILLYIHGGGWSLPWTGGHRYMLAQICEKAGVTGVAVKYRLAPEHPFPAALEDVLTVYRHLIENGFPPTHILLGGDSAGGNLTVASMLCMKGDLQPLPAAGICISPMMDLTENSPIRERRGWMVPPDFVMKLARFYGAGLDRKNPLISPIFGDISGLPPLLIQCGGRETLYPDIMRFAEKARASGVEVEFQVWEEMFHVHQIFAKLLPEGKEAISNIASFIQKILKIESIDRTTT